MTHYHVFLPPSQLAPLSSFSKDLIPVEALPEPFGFRQLKAPIDGHELGLEQSLSQSRSRVLRRLGRAADADAMAPLGPENRNDKTDDDRNHASGSSPPVGWQVNLPIEVTPVPRISSRPAQTTQVEPPSALGHGKEDIERMEGIKRARGALRKTQSDLSDGSRRKSSRLSRGAGRSCPRVA